MSLARSLKVLPITAAVLLVSTSSLAAPAAQRSTKKQVAQAPATPSAPAGSDSKAGDGSGGDTAIQEARTRYNRGIELYNEGDYKLALIEFQRSYDLSPNWRILYNLGEVHFQLNNYAQALKTLEKYLAEGGKEIPEKRRDDVEKDIEALKSRTAYLTVTVNVPDAEISVDDNPIGKSPLPPDVLVDAGQHRISATKPGFRAASKSMTLAGREHQSLTLDLTEEPKLVAPPPAAPEPKSSYVWLGWVGAGAFAAGATVTGLLSLDAKSDLDGLRGKQGVTRAELDDQESKMKTLGIATDVLVGAAVITAGVTLVLTLTSHSSRAETAKSTSTAATRIGLSPRGMGLGGVF